MAYQRTNGNLQNGRCKIETLGGCKGAKFIKTEESAFAQDYPLITKQMNFHKFLKIFTI